MRPSIYRKYKKARGLHFIHVVDGDRRYSSLTTMYFLSLSCCLRVYKNKLLVTGAVQRILYDSLSSPICIISLHRIMTLGLAQLEIHKQQYLESAGKYLEFACRAYSVERSHLFALIRKMEHFLHPALPALVFFKCRCKFFVVI